MIRFSIDGIPMADDFTLATDYNSKIVYTAICDPLFKFDRENNDYICNACLQYYISNNYKMYTIALRDDLYYSNGNKVNPADYKKAIYETRKNNKLLSCYLENIEEIFCSKNQIVFILKKSDMFFVKKLSLYQLSPSYNNQTSGAFVIKERTSENIRLAPNIYFRETCSFEIDYIIQTDNIRSISDFEKRIIDITNNTLYPIGYKNNNGKYNIEDSFIIYNFEISSKIPRKIRKEIVNCVDKENVKMLLGGNVSVTDTFSINNYKLKELKCSKNNYHKSIVIGYNNFYPNKIVAKALFRDLKNHNYNVELSEYNYQDVLDNKIDKYDINLVLNYFEFIDPLYFYESKYFLTIMKNNKKYKTLLNSYKEKGSDKTLRKIYKMFRNNYLKEPIVMTKSVFLTNDKTHGFSFIELNYDILN